MKLSRNEYRGYDNDDDDGECDDDEGGSRYDDDVGGAVEMVGVTRWIDDGDNARNIVCTPSGDGSS